MSHSDGGQGVGVLESATRVEGQFDYDVLLIDLDDTIVDYQETERLALDLLYDEFFAGRMDQDDFLERFVEINDDLWAQYRRGAVSLESLHLGRFRQLYGNMRYESQAPVEAAEFFERALGASVVLFPDSLPALRQLRKCYRLVLLSDGLVSVQNAKLQQGGLNDMFEEVILAKEIGLRKPDPRLIDECLRVAGISRDRVLVVGDSIESDGVGAREAGVDFCWVRRRSAPPARPPVEATWVVPDLLTLARQLCPIWSGAVTGPSA